MFGTTIKSKFDKKKDSKQYNYNTTTKMSSFLTTTVKEAFKNFVKTEDQNRYTAIEDAYEELKEEN